MSRRVERPEPAVNVAGVVEDDYGARRDGVDVGEQLLPGRRAEIDQPRLFRDRKDVEMPDLRCRDLVANDRGKMLFKTGDRLRVIVRAAADRQVFNISRISDSEASRGIGNSSLSRSTSSSIQGCPANSNPLQPPRSSTSKSSRAHNLSR